MDLQIETNNKHYEELLGQSKNQISVDDRLKTIEQFLSSDYNSPDDIDDDTVKNLVDKIIINDDIIDVYLKNGEHTNVSNSQVKSLCVTATGQYRTHTEKIYSQKVRRIKNRTAKSWLYFNVYL